MEQPKILNILSLGAGVQSTCLALMAEKGEVTPNVDHAIFADVGAEPAPVMRHLDELEKLLSYPVHRVMEKDGLKNEVLRSAKGQGRCSNPPFFAKNENGKKRGMLMRQCTRDYKVYPLDRKAKELAGIKKYERVNDVRVITWMGISLDEIQRMRISQNKWSEYRYPLIEMKMTRQDCLDWMQDNGYAEPPRSACTFCPYHSDKEWKRIKKDDPESWNDAVAFDKAIRNGVHGTTKKLFLHTSCVPLDEVEFKKEKVANQEFYNFQNACEGMCGV